MTGCLPDQVNQGNQRKIWISRKMSGKNQGSLLKFLDSQGEIRGIDLICF